MAQSNTQYIVIKHVDVWNPIKPHMHTHSSRLAQSLMARSASLKVSWLGTKLRIVSVTRQPSMLCTHSWSKFLSSDVSSRSRLSATLGWDRRENDRCIWNIANMLKKRYRVEGGVSYHSDVGCL